MITLGNSQAQYLVPFHLRMQSILLEVLQEPYFWCLNDGYGITMDCDSGADVIIDLDIDPVA